jgi:aspartyl-tRNA synthetase
MKRPPPSELATRYRTHSCGELRAEHVFKPDPGPAAPIPIHDDVDIVLPRRPAKSGPETVVLCGHVEKKIGADTVLLRDHYGKTLVQVDPAALPYVPDRFSKLSPEDVIQVSGVVTEREEKDRDAANPTGAVFLQVKKIEVLSRAASFPGKILTADELPTEEKLRFRQIYLRRPEMQQRLQLRSKLAHEMREHLVGEEFVELETPHLFWYDPVAIGGEVIPHGKGKAWRLPSGPVVLNQYIKGGQFDRFFQFLRVTRRENNPTPQHQQEHTSLDINMSYVDVPDFQAQVERLLAHAIKAALGKELVTPFPSYSYAEAMAKFGTDKPDVRFGLEIGDLPDGKGFRAVGASPKLGDKDLAGLKFTRKGEDLLVYGNDPVKLGEIRLKLAKKLGLIDENKFAPVWVHSYPFLDSQMLAQVVVFATPVDEDRSKLEDLKERGNVRARAFDLILNGVEVASGYIGNWNMGAQRMIWSSIFQIGQADIFRLRSPIEAHRFGVPPHGGINFGFDRLVALLLGVPAIDEVMAFPKTPACTDPMLGAPGPVPAAAIQDLIDEHPKPAYGVPELSEETANL